MAAKFKEGLLWFGLWLLLALLAGLLVSQIYTAVMIGGTTLVHSRFRPLYWSSFRLAWLARFLSVILGGGWIFFISFIEAAMTRWHKRNQLVPSCIKLAGQLVVASLIAFVLSQIIVYLP